LHDALPILSGIRSSILSNASKKVMCDGPKVLTTEVGLHLYAYKHLSIPINSFASRTQEIQNNISSKYVMLSSNLLFPIQDLLKTLLTPYPRYPLLERILSIAKFFDNFFPRNFGSTTWFFFISEKSSKILKNKIS